MPVIFETSGSITDFPDSTVTSCYYLLRSFKEEGRWLLPRGIEQEKRRNLLTTDPGLRYRMIIIDSTRAVELKLTGSDYPAAGDGFLFEPSSKAAKWLSEALENDGEKAFYLEEHSIVTDNLTRRYNFLIYPGEDS